MTIGDVTVSIAIGHFRITSGLFFESSLGAHLFMSKFHSHANGPSSIYQYSNMAPRLSGLASIFGVVSFVSKSLLGIERQMKL